MRSPQETSPRARDVRDDSDERFFSHIFEKYGYDFSEYKKAPLTQKIRRFMKREGKDWDKLGNSVLERPEAMEEFLAAISQKSKSFFQDGIFWKELSRQVMPWLKTFPSVRIWSVGCGSPEELYSLAIWLAEHKLEALSIYATDTSAAQLHRAKEGRFNADRLKEFEIHYEEAGGKGRLRKYFSSTKKGLFIKDELSKRILFFQHNLVTDGSFNEFHAIFCRGTLNFFKKPLQNQVFSLFSKSLYRFGLLALDAGEAPHVKSFQEEYRELAHQSGIYKRIG